MKSFLVGIMILIITGISLLSAYKISAMNRLGYLNRSYDFSLENDLTIQPQKPGVFVQISSVSLQSPGFISIKDENKQINYGNSTILPPGLTTNTRIELHTPVSSGDNLVAELFIDNGNKIFDNTPVDIQAVKGTISVRRFFYIK